MRMGTIIARNYLPYARTLARSFAEHHPGGECWVLVVDDPRGGLDDAAEPWGRGRPPPLHNTPVDGLAPP